nr:ArsR family transcriptional regulator [Halarchaeum sp. CBA1220]
MSIWDDRLLEILRAEGPKSVGDLTDHDVIHVSQPTVSRRLKRLAEHDLAIAIGNGVYQISDEGEAYLNEEYDAEAGAYVNSEAEGESSTAGTEANGA